MAQRFIHDEGQENSFHCQAQQGLMIVKSMKGLIPKRLERTEKTTHITQSKNFSFSLNISILYGFKY